MSLQPGTHVAQYRIVRLIGAGRAAEVYEVIAPGGRRRALKVLRMELPKDPRSPRWRERLGQEGESVATIEHVHVVTFLDAGEWEGRLWILLELVEGRDLEQLAREAGGALPVARVVSIVRQACEGVEAAHRAGILHRDLNPSNLLVAADNLTKVADFGSAKPASWGVKTTREQDVSSSLYAAPEYASRRRAEPKSDVYSMGIVLYETLAGVHPIVPGPATAYEITRRHMVHVPAPLSSVRADVPGDLSDLAAWALVKDPARRCSMRELADGLAAVQQRLLAPRRALARNLAAAHPDVGLAPTEPALPAFGPGGTMAMPAVASGAAPRRHTTLPPPPAATARSVPAARPLPVTVAMSEAGAACERRTTGIPVESSARRSSAGTVGGAPRRGLAWAAGAAAAVLGLGLATASWLLVGRGVPAAPASPPPPPPPASASSAAPTASASSAGPRAAPPRSRPAPRGRTP